MITKPGKQVLLPVIFYLDAANTGHFVDLPITALKLSLGIFNRKARDKNHMWRILGYVPAVSKHKSRGFKIILESHHVDAIMMDQDAQEHEGNKPNTHVAKAQDLHSMLEIIMASYIKLQKTGFVWDLRYQGRLYKDIEFVLFTPFIKVDGDEAEKLCGKYTTRTGNVKQLCRYCTCPTDKTDSPHARYPYKTMAMIEALIEADDMEGLKQLSQQYIKNSM